MMPGSSNSYKFGNFTIDTERLVLYHDGNLLKTVEKKPLEVLALLVTSARHLVSHEEIIAKVWGDNRHGVTPARINQYISRLRKTLAEYEPASRYIENVRGRGYIFAEDVQPVRGGPASIPGSQDPKPIILPSPKPVKRATYAYLLVGALVAAAIGVAGWAWFSEDERGKIAKLIKESQHYESLVLYEDPSTFKEEDLDRFWMREVESNQNYDRRTIRDAVKRLIAEGRKYGKETKNEQFDIQSIEVAADGQRAIGKTLEKWFIAEYRNDGTLIQNKTVGPYFVSYILRKLDGRWLIEKSNTARTARPTPQLASIDMPGEIIAEKEFAAHLAGQDFEPETVHIEIVGPSCPEAKPCRVPNTVLRAESSMSATGLRDVPLKLSAGEHRIVVRNGDSPPSMPVYVKIP